MSLQSTYAKYSISDIRRFILNRKDYSDEAAFYLLRYRMQEKFAALYNEIKPRMDYDDVLMDFYLFLRDGKKSSDQKTYHAIEGLRSWWAFEPWLLTTFRRFLLSLAGKDVKTYSEDKLASIADEQQSNHEKLDKEINVLAHAIAFKDMWGSAEDRFIMYRSLMYSLDKERMIGRKDMAAAMGLTDVNYRTKDSRVRKNLKETIGKIRDNQSPNRFILNERGKAVAEDIEKNYVDFFSVVAKLYETALSELEAQHKVEELRKRDLEEQKRKAAEKKAAEEKSEHKDESDTRYSVRDSSTRYSTRDSYSEPATRYSVRESSSRSSGSSDSGYRWMLGGLTDENLRRMLAMEEMAKKKQEEIDRLRRTQETPAEKPKPEPKPVPKPQPKVEFKADFSDLNPRKHFINSINRFINIGN